MASPPDMLFPSFQNALASQMQNQLAQSQANALSGLFGGGGLGSVGGLAQQATTAIANARPNSVVTVKDLEEIRRSVVDETKRITNKFEAERLYMNMLEAERAKDEMHRYPKFKSAFKNVTIKDSSPVLSPSLPTHSLVHRQLRCEIEGWLPKVKAA